jgi:hypothetical protein
VDIIIGKVSALEGAREHLDVLGRAHCGAGNGRTIAATRWRADATLRLSGICKRCLKALRKRIADAAAAGDTAAAGAVIALEPDDPRRDAALLADIRAHLRRVHTPEPTPLELSGLHSHEYAARLLASLRD